jgi:hypothetical protein
MGPTHQVLFSFPLEGGTYRQTVKCVAYIFIQTAGNVERKFLHKDINNNYKFVQGDSLVCDSSSGVYD